MIECLDIHINGLTKRCRFDEPKIAPAQQALMKWLKDANASSVLVRGDRHIFGVGEIEDLARSFRQMIDHKTVD